MHKYKLKKEFAQDGERSFIGIGETKNGILESAVEVESPLLEAIEESAPAPTPQPVAQTAAAAPAPVAAPQTQTNTETN